MDLFTKIVSRLAGACYVWIRGHSLPALFIVVFVVYFPMYELESFTL